MTSVRLHVPRTERTGPRDLLADLVPDGVASLCDRRAPSGTEVGHVVVAPAGIWVLAGEQATGRVGTRNAGGWLRADERLVLAGEDRTAVVDGLARQAGAVRAALGRTGSDVPVRALLCVEGARWGWLAKPVTVRGVVVAWPRAASAHLRSLGRVHLDPDRLEDLHRVLDGRLPARVRVAV